MITAHLPLAARTRPTPPRPGTSRQGSGTSSAVDVPRYSGSAGGSGQSPQEVSKAICAKTALPIAQTRRCRLSPGCMQPPGSHVPLPLYSSPLAWPETFCCLPARFRREQATRYGASAAPPLVQPRFWTHGADEPSVRVARRLPTSVVPTAATAFSRLTSERSHACQLSAPLSLASRLRVRLGRELARRSRLWSSRAARRRPPDAPSRVRAAITVSALAPVQVSPCSRREAEQAPGPAINSSSEHL